VNAPFALPAEFIEREPEPIDLDPRPCGLCGRTVDEHEFIDHGEGPEFFCYPDDDVVTQWELAEPTVDAARGAGALVAGLRALRVLAGMTKAEAERAGIENPYRYFRVFSGKLNMAPREDKSEWHFLESVDLGNRTTDRPSDHVQVAVAWQWPNALDGLATRDLFAVQKHVSEGTWRESAQSSEWVGKAVAEVLDLDLESAPLQNRVKSLLKTWLASGALKVVTKLDEHRKERKFVEVGQWATD
jgi:hypothetical protein